jgi:hypothetical protein
MIRSAISFPVRSEPVPRNYPATTLRQARIIITSGRKQKHPSNQAKPDFLKHVFARLTPKMTASNTMAMLYRNEW